MVFFEFEIKMFAALSIEQNALLVTPKPKPNPAHCHIATFRLHFEKSLKIVKQPFKNLVTTHYWFANSVLDRSMFRSGFELFCCKFSGVFIVFLLMLDRLYIFSSV